MPRKQTNGDKAMKHYFETSGHAYNASQCDENIQTGDLLIILSEKVIGIADTWPFAVTKAHGKLHTTTKPIEELLAEDFFSWQDNTNEERAIFIYAVREALELAKFLNW
jgi:hypothetical protein